MTWTYQPFNRKVEVTIYSDEDTQEQSDMVYGAMDFSKRVLGKIFSTENNYEIYFDVEIGRRNESKTKIILFNLANETIDSFQVGDRIILKAGYDNMFGVIFDGNISSVEISSGVDTRVAIRCTSNSKVQSLLTTPLSISAIDKERVSVSEYVDAIIDKLGFNVAYMSPDAKNTYLPSYYSANATASRIFDELVSYMNLINEWRRFQVEMNVWQTPVQPKRYNWKMDDLGNFFLWGSGESIGKEVIPIAMDIISMNKVIVETENEGDFSNVSVEDQALLSKQEMLEITLPLNYMVRFGSRIEVGGKIYNVEGVIHRNDGRRFITIARCT